MGLLDDLQVRADKIKFEQQQRRNDIELQQDFYEAELKPVMLLAYEYFARLIENLKLVKPRINPGYPLNPTQKSEVTLNQTDYEFFFDHGESPHQLDIRCVCTLDPPVEFYLPSKTAVLNLSELLDDHKFFYHRRDRRGRTHDICGATFTLEGPMPVHIRLEAAPADRCVYVHLLNLESQPYKRYKFSADKVDGALLERLAKLLVREESKLVEVEVSEGMRSELRRRLEIENRRREAELARAYAEMEAEKSAEREAKLTFRLTRAIQHRTGLAMDYMKSRMAEADSRLKKYKNR